LFYFNSVIGHEISASQFTSQLGKKKGKARGYYFVCLATKLYYKLPKRVSLLHPTTMSSLWARLSHKYPSQFNTHTIPVWTTLVPCIAGGIIWAGYIGFRTMIVHNEIV